MNSNFFAKSVKCNREETELFASLLIPKIYNFLVLDFNDVDGSQNALLQGSVLIFWVLF